MKETYPAHFERYFFFKVNWILDYAFTSLLFNSVLFSFLYSA